MCKKICGGGKIWMRRCGKHVNKKMYRIRRNRRCGREDTKE